MTVVSPTTFPLPQTGQADPFVLGNEIPVHHELDQSVNFTTASVVFVNVGVGINFQRFIADIPTPPPGYDTVFRYICHLRPEAVLVFPNVVETRIFNVTDALAVTGSTLTKNTLGDRRGDTLRSGLLSLSEINLAKTYSIQARTSIAAVACRITSYKLVAYWRKL